MILSPNVGLTAAQTKNGMENTSYIRFYDGASEVSDTALAKTGYTVKVVNGSTLLAEYTLAVHGDVDCDGKTTTSDIRNSLKALAGTTQLSVAQEAAADYDNDGSLSSKDTRAQLSDLF